LGSAARLQRQDQHLPLAPAARAVVFSPSGGPLFSTGAVQHPSTAIPWKAQAEPVMLAAEAGAAFANRLPDALAQNWVQSVRPIEAEASWLPADLGPAVQRDPNAGAA